MIERVNVARRLAGCVVGAAALLGAPATSAQQPKKVPEIAVLFAGKSPSDYVDALRQGLRDLGYIEGKSITIVYRFAEQKSERLPPLAAELVALKPDVIVTSTYPGVLAAKKATTTIPIVVAASGDLVQRGLAASYARPGGNITGLSFISAYELDEKRLELLKEAILALARVAYLVNPNNPGFDRVPASLADASRRLGIRVERVEARAVEEFEAAVAEAARLGAGALLIANDLLFNQNPELLARLAVSRRLPTISEQKLQAEAGALMAYGTEVRDMWRAAARHVDKILKGASPGDLPIELPTRIPLTVNLKTARALGITMPQSILVRADEVIE